MQPGNKKCGAKTRKGTPCADIAMANGRCKRHGGKATGPKKPHVALAEANPAYTHGIYTKFFKDEEKVLIDAGAIKLGEVDAELTVMRIRLKRALEAREKWEAERSGEIDGSDETTSMVLVERNDDEAAGFEGSVLELEKKAFRLPDYDGIIDRVISRIESLEKTRKELLKDGGGNGDDDLPEGERGRDHVTFTGGLDGTDGELPSPFGDEKKSGR
jgi:hypothetical protein